MSKGTEFDAFNKRVERTKGCWKWFGSVYNGGYGCLPFNREAKIEINMKKEICSECGQVINRETWLKNTTKKLRQQGLPSLAKALRLVDKKVKLIP